MFWYSQNFQLKCLSKSVFLSINSKKIQSTTHVASQIWKPSFILFALIICHGWGSVLNSQEILQRLRTADIEIKWFLLKKLHGKNCCLDINQFGATLSLKYIFLKLFCCSGLKFILFMGWSISKRNMGILNAPPLKT